MVGTNQMLPAVGFLLMVAVCKACITVYEEEPFCIENGEFSMKCPTDHYLIIKDAAHKVVKTGPCPTDLSSVDTCTLSDLTKNVSKTCQKKNNCTVSVSDSSTACSGYTGNKFVTVTYKCEPEFIKSSKAMATAFCSDISLEGSLAFLNNALIPKHATRCLCTITVPQNVNVDVNRLYDDGNCANFVNMVDEEDKPTDFCQVGEMLCKDGGRQLHFEYIPKGQNSAFIGISVSHKASFKLQCKINPMTTTTAATTTPTTQTTTVATTKPMTQTTTVATTTPTQAPTTRPPVTTATESTTTKPPKAPASTEEPGNDVTTATLETTSANSNGGKAEPQKTKSGLGQNIVIGIGVVAAFILIMIMVIACVVCYRKNKNHSKSDVDPYYHTMDELQPTSDKRDDNDYDFSY